MKGRRPNWFASSARQDWCTPDAELATVREVFGGTIGLDPCSNPGSRVFALRELQLERGEDGLAIDWRGCGAVYVNPPYGRTVIAPFTTKARREFDSVYRGRDQCLLLLPANTDVSWFHDDCQVADALCFQRGRIAFRAPGGMERAMEGSTVGNLWVYWGDWPARFCEVFALKGFAVTTPSGERRTALRSVLKEASKFETHGGASAGALD